MTLYALFQSTSKCANKIVWFIKFIHKDKKVVQTRIFCWAESLGDIPLFQFLWNIYIYIWAFVKQKQEAT